MTRDHDPDDADRPDSPERPPVATAKAKGWRGTVVQALAIGVGVAVGQYVGVHLLPPLATTFAVWWAARRWLPSDRNSIAAALALNAGHFVWLAIALVMEGVLNAAVVDLVVYAIGIAWLVARPGVGPLCFLAAYQMLALGLNALTLVDAATGSEPHKAVLVTAIWRAMALIAMGRLWVTSRRQRVKASETTTA